MKYEISDDINFNKNSKEYKIFLNYTKDDYKQEIINKLSSKGMKDSDISDVVGLSESEVRKIINNDK